MAVPACRRRRLVFMNWRASALTLGASAVLGECRLWQRLQDALQMRPIRLIQQTLLQRGFEHALEHLGTIRVEGEPGTSGCA